MCHMSLFTCQLSPGVQKMDKCTKNLLKKLSSVAQLGHGNTQQSVLVSDCWTTSFANIWTVLCPTNQWLDNGFTNVKRCFVKLSNGWSMLCPMAGELSIQQSNSVQMSKGRIMLCQTVQWLDCAVLTLFCQIH